MTLASNKTVMAEIRDIVLSSKDRFWKPKDFEGPPSAVAKALSRLTATGDLRRIRRGLYWRGSATPLGMAPPPAMRLTRELVGTRGVGPAKGSAALVLGLSTHVPRADTVAVTSRVPASPTDTLRFVSRSGSSKRLEERLNTSEIAFLEVLLNWDRYVEVSTPDALDRISRLIDEGFIRVDRIVNASETEPARSRDRLRGLLRSMSRDDDANRVLPSRHPNAAAPAAA